MKKTKIYNYVKSIINDDYAMEVLFYCVWKKMIDNNYSLYNVAQINISLKYHEEAVSININNKFDTGLDAFSLLLSIRALMLDKNILNYCYDDNLFFVPYFNRKYYWIELSSTILHLWQDDVFYSLYCMLDSIYYNNDLSETEKEEFIQLMENAPEFRNIHNYYRTVASGNSEIIDDVICDNAFVCKDSLVVYYIPKKIEYVGNTAFSYCEKLETIHIQNPKIEFGKFPIIECPRLTKIIVPRDTKKYYQEQLPYYKNIIIEDDSPGDNLASD